MSIEDFIKILQASIAPVVLISGIGMLMLSMTNRLARPIDGIRRLLNEIKKLSPSERLRVFEQVDILFRRAQYLQRAIILAALSIFTVCLIILFLFLSFIWHLPLVNFVVLLFPLVWICVSASLIFFLRDIGLALTSVKIEIERVKTNDKDPV